MAIQWGAWEYGGGNGMRVGVEVFSSSVSHSSSSVTYTLKFYTENQWRYDDYQSLNFGGALSGSEDYNNTHGTNSWGGGAIHHATREYTYNYPSNSYGSSPASRTFTATVSGAYNGVTPSVSVSEDIPARPYDDARPPSNLDPSRVSDTATDLSWTNHPTAGEPYFRLDLRRWDNVNDQTKYDIVDNYIAETATTYRDSTTVANRRYRYAIRAHNTAGKSSWDYSPYIQTTPASPSGASVRKSTVSSVIVSWSNGASTTNGYRYTTEIEQSVNGGSWVLLESVGAGIRERVVEGLTPGDSYRFRVRATSTVGATTWSAYSTTESIQLQQAPAEPTGLSVTRVNDNRFTLDWTNNPNGDIAPYGGLKVQRLTSGSAKWENVASLSATTATFTDTSTVVNRRYEWRVRAENAAGNSDWVYFTPYQTRPAVPSDITARVNPGGSVTVEWVNHTEYGANGDHLNYIRHYKDGVLATTVASVSGADNSYTLTQIDAASTYQFEVEARSTVGYSSVSGWATGASFPASTIPHPPTNIRLEGGGSVFDAALGAKILWDHNPSEDGSDQTAFQPRVSTDGGATWTELVKETSTNEFFVTDPGQFQNGQDALFSYRTWGVHATASDWSDPLALTLSATPVITINEPSSTTLPISHLTVDWAYSDSEGTPQASWEIELLTPSGAILEQRSANDTTSTVEMATVIDDGKDYLLRLRVFDGDGLSSGWQELSLTADFVPPAEPVLTADYSDDNGTTVLTLTPTPDDGGVTTLPASGVDIQRRLINPATGEYGPWSLLVENMSADTTLVDTTAAIAGDGQYRLVTHSEAPSAVTSEPLTPNGSDDRWVYLSGGENFTQVCRLMGNIALRTKSSRERALYHFAGRELPVMYTGEARERVIEISGLLDGESSTPAEWEELIASGGVLLLRDPLGHRIYGSVPDVSIDRLGGGMHSISFIVTEVSFP